jgi:hypothetical protein
MSVMRLISMPGEISTQREASPTMDKNPLAVEPMKAVSCGCKLSRKVYDRKSTAKVALRGYDCLCIPVNLRLEGPSSGCSGDGAQSLGSR